MGFPAQVNADNTQGLNYLGIHRPFSGGIWCNTCAEQSSHADAQFVRNLVLAPSFVLGRSRGRPVQASAAKDPQEVL